MPSRGTGRCKVQEARESRAVSGALSPSEIVGEFEINMYTLLHLCGSLDGRGVSCMFQAMGNIFHL